MYKKMSNISRTENYKTFECTNIINLKGKIMLRS